MMTPTIHLNGTSKDALVNELARAHGAVIAAIEAVAHVTVHGRDYYPQGPDAYVKARREMDERLNKLRSVANDLQAMAEQLWAGDK